MGGQHRYQWLVTICMGVIAMSITMTSFLNPFLFHQTQYTCGSDITDCQAHVCSLLPEERSKFIPSYEKSMADSFGDYRCERSTL